MGQVTGSVPLELCRGLINRVFGRLWSDPCHISQCLSEAALIGEFGPGRLGCTHRPMTLPSLVRAKTRLPSLPMMISIRVLGSSNAIVGRLLSEPPTQGRSRAESEAGLHWQTPS